MSADLRFIAKLEKNSADHPESIALISVESGGSTTYAKLWECSGCVYAFLKQEGIGREDVVMIAVPRGTDSIITLIGIWRAGAAAIMLDAEYEPERMAYIMKNSGCVLKIDADLLGRI